MSASTIKTLNVVSLIPFAIAHLYFGYKASIGFDHYVHPSPILSIGKWAWLGFQGQALLVILFQIYQFFDSALPVVAGVIGSRYAVASLVQILAILVWVRTANYLAAFILSALLWLLVLSIYLDVQRKHVSRSFFDLFAVQGLFSFWLVWSTYLTIFIGSQAFNLVHGNIHTSTVWTSIFILALFAAISIGSAITSDSRPAGDFNHSFGTFWVTLGVFTAVRHQHKLRSLAWVSGLLAVLTGLVFVYSSYTAYQAYQARIFLVEDDEAADERRALLSSNA